MVSSDEDHVARLTERVARLERRLGHREPERGPVDAEEGEEFWVLDRLKAQSRPAVLYAGIVDQGERGTVQWQMTHGSVDLLEEAWSDRAASLSALGHPVRMRILQLVARAEADTAAELARTEGLGTTGQIYHHLRMLVAAGWLRTTTRGRHQVPPERLVPLLVILGASR